MRRKFRNLMSLLLVFVLVIQPFQALGIAAEDTQEYVTVCIERFTLGQGYFIEPTKVPIEDGDTAADALLELFSENSVEYESTGTVAGQTFYLSSIKNADTKVLNIPSFITENGGPSNTDNDGNSDSYLGEFDYSYMSGWMITVNNSMINVGSSAYEVEDGDVIRWAFTLWGYGADLGYSNDWGSTAYYSEPDRTNLIRVIGEAKSEGSSFISANQTVYSSALSTASDVSATQSEVNSAYETLEAALTGEEDTQASSSVSPKSLDYTIQNATDQVSQYLLDTVTAPTCGSIGGEWAVLQLARSGNITTTFKNTYLTNLTAYVEGKDGVLSTSKLTEYSRVIIALAALNEDATDFDGYNLVKPLANYTNTVKQGINGAIYALIALDTKNYVIPTVEDGGTQTTRDNLVQYILDKEIDGGGWALSGTTPDPDITAMAIQSLSTYYESNTSVKTAVDEGVAVLAGLQNTEGGFSSWGTVNSESVSQVICALCSLGIDPVSDSRFIQEDGSWLLSNLLSFAVPTGTTLAFAHTGTTANQMATEQAGYAICAYNRLLKGETSLYDMSVTTDTSAAADTTTSLSNCAAVVTPDFVENKTGEVFNVVLRTGKYSDSLMMLDGSFSLADNLEVENVTMSSNISGGTLSWNVDSNTLRFVYGDLSSGKALTVTDKTQLDVLTITLKITSVSEGQDSVAFSMNSFREIEDSETYESLYDSNQVSAIPLVSFDVSAQILYTGDGSDIIPNGKRAVRVDIAGVDLGSYELDFSLDAIEYSKLYISKNFTSYYGHTIYVMVVDSDVTESQLNDVENYSVFEDTKASSVQFADTNGDGVIDAQDALNEVSLWLRKVEKDVTSDLILTYNVNADERIDSLDALAVVEAFVSGTQFDVMNR